MAGTTGHRRCLGDIDGYYKTNIGDFDLTYKHYDIGTVYICDQRDLTFDNEQYRSGFSFGRLWNGLTICSSLNDRQWIFIQTEVKFQK